MTLICKRLFGRFHLYLFILVFFYLIWNVSFNSDVLANLKVVLDEIRSFIVRHFLRNQYPQGSFRIKFCTWLADLKSYTFVLLVGTTKKTKETKQPFQYCRFLIIFWLGTFHCVLFACVWIVKVPICTFWP